MKIQVREGKLGDAVALCRLRRRVWLSCYVNAEQGITKERILSVYRFTDRESLATMRETLQGGEGGEVGVFVAEALLQREIRKVVGFGVGERRGNRLTMLYVDSVCQGRGVGGMLSTGFLILCSSSLLFSACPLTQTAIHTPPAPLLPRQRQIPSASKSPERSC